MTAAQDNLARWWEAEQGATEGPWRWRNTQDVYLFGAHTRVVMAFRRMGMNSAQPQFRDAQNVLQDAGRANLNAFPDATFIATSREAMPALLAFTSEILALATTDKTVCFCVTQERLLKVAEQHLGGAR